MTRITINKIASITDGYMGGFEIIEAADRLGWNIGKHADSAEDGRDGLAAEEAHDIAREDVSLVYVDVPGQIAVVDGRAVHMPADYDASIVTADDVQHDGEIIAL